MKSDFIIAVTQLAAERNLPREVVLKALEAALVSAYKKDDQATAPNIQVRILPSTGEVMVFTLKTVVEKPVEDHLEISLEEARRIKKGVSVGEEMEVEVTPHSAGRIAAQTAKQVVMQRLREAERELIYEEYSEREGDIVSGVVQRIEPKQVIIDLGRAEAVLPLSEQIPMERYRVGQRIKSYLLQVQRVPKGPQLIVSRTHRNLVRRFFELEVPEISNGVVELKAIAREPGQRSKVAVFARQEGVDAVGSCIGLRGIRIQNIVNELRGEKIDVVQWHPDIAVFIAHSLSPAQVASVVVGEENKTATVVVPDRQLSLAIGKEGQNARLAAKLTGLRIDIKGVSEAEAEKAAQEAQMAIPEEPPSVAVVEEAVAEEAAKGAVEVEEVAVPEEEAFPVTEELMQPEEAEPAPVEEAPSVEETIAAAVPLVPEGPPERGPLRFAEDILQPKASKPGSQRRRSKRKRRRVPEGGEEVVRDRRGKLRISSPEPELEVEAYEDPLE